MNKEQYIDEKIRQDINEQYAHEIRYCANCDEAIHPQDERVDYADMCFCSEECLDEHARRNK